MAFARLSCFFVVTEKHVLFCKDSSELLDLAKNGQLAFSFMLDNQEIGPAVKAGLVYLDQIRNGAPRCAALLEATAASFGL